MSNPILPAAGTTVATDTVSGADMQKVKLDGGGAGASVPIVAGQQNLANSIPVAPASDWINAPYQQGGSVYIGSTAYAIQRAAIAAGSSGDNIVDPEDWTTG